MTIEQLLDCSVDQLEQMSDEELNKHIAPSGWHGSCFTINHLAANLPPKKLDF